MQIGVQRSRNNGVSANLIVGGEKVLEFSEECREEDMVNDISGKAFCGIKDEESLMSGFGTVYQARAEIADGFCSLPDDIGSCFMPDGELLDLYYEQKGMPFMIPLFLSPRRTNHR